MDEDRVREQRREETQRITQEKTPLPTMQPMLRVTLKKEEKFFGPGVATLMHQIECHGSIQAAAKSMEMSYSKAWKILRRAEHEIGYPLIVSQNGGAGGGRSVLSEQGKSFLLHYDALAADVNAYLQERARHYFGETVS